MNTSRASARASSRTRNRLDADEGRDTPTNVDDSRDPMSEIDATPMAIQDGKIAKVEPDIADMKEQLYKEKLQSIKLEIDMLKNGNFDPIKDELEKLEGIKRERVNQSESAKRTQIKAISNIYDAEIKAAEDEFEADKQDTAERMLTSLREKERRLEEFKDRDVQNFLDDGPERGIQTRNQKRETRGKRGDPVVEKPVGPATKKKKDLQSAYLSVQLNRPLTEDEMLDDLENIKKGVSTTRGVVRSTWADQNALFDVRVDKGFLFYQNQVFERGDRVMLELSGQREKGEIVAITNAEVSIRTTETKKARIYLSQLKNGRAFLLPGPPAETSSEDEMMDMD